MEMIQNIIPIIIITILVLYPENASHFANTILGKMIAIVLIIFYSLCRIEYGVIICILIIAYYRNMHYEEGFQNAKELFREQNCKNGILTNKNLPVKTEMAQQIFPELNFKKNQCNPCDNSCDFSILEEKMKNEESLTAPKNSNDWFHETWSTITNISSNPIPTTSNKSFSTIM